MKYVCSSSFLPGLSIKFPSGKGLVGLWSILQSMQFWEGERCHSHGDDGGVGEPSQGCQSLACKVHYKCNHLAGLFLQKRIRFFKLPSLILSEKLCVRAYYHILNGHFWCHIGSV